MKSSMILVSSWLAADPRRTKMMLAGAALLMLLAGLGGSVDDVLAGKAVGGVH
jgi:F0F1-type ATP synthase membrane subunit c/vacuolar-type H+-ATPase subunit K